MLHLYKNSRLNNCRCLINYIRNVSSQTKLQEVPVDSEQLNLSTRVIKKRPTKPPFMKNLFLGNFDSDLLAFPEVLDKEELNNVDNLVSQIDAVLTDAETTVPQIDISNFREKLKHLKIYGLQASKQADGLELSETENARVFEILSQCSSLGISLANHHYLGVNAITSKGNAHILKKYLINLCRGDSLAAFCLLEKDVNDVLSMKTTAVKTPDEKHWILNGTKSWVVNGNQGDIYIVVANTHGDDVRESIDKMSIFIVEKTMDGITTSPCEISGFKGIDVCNVSFNNTHVPAENMLGEGADSMKIINPLLSGLRLSTGPGCITLLHKLIKEFSNYCLNTKHGSKYICDTDTIRDKIAKININLYAIESVTYMTAGLLDKYEKQDCELESAIVKIFSSERSLESVQECMKLVGPFAFSKDSWLYPLYNDALGHVLLNETNSSLRIVISLLGLQFSGVELQDNVKKLRNPFFFPAYIVKKMFEHRRQDADDPRMDLILENYLHPSLTFSARWLEYCVYRLKYATETMLIRHGPEIINQHMELLKLADVAIDIYAMVAVLSRASRSYCIGLQNADAELLLANSYCLDARERVKQKVLEITRGQYGTNDANLQHIAKRAFKFDGYFAEHPLTKNF